MKSLLYALLALNVLAPMAAGQTGAKPKTAELEWAREIADGFLQAACAGHGDELRPYVSERLWPKFAPAYMPLYNLLGNGVKDKLARWKIEKEKLSPEGDEAHLSGTLTGPQHQANFKMLLQKGKDGKWRVDAFSAVPTAEALEKRLVQQQELKWAKQIAADFLRAWGGGNSVSARPLLSSELKNILGKPGDEERWLQGNRYIGWSYLADIAPSWSTEELAEGGGEACFAGSLTESSKCQRIDFQIRLTKDKAWRVLTFETTPTPTPLLKSAVAHADQKLDCWSGWLPEKLAAQLGFPSNAAFALLDPTQYELLRKNWNESTPNALPALDSSKVLPIGLLNVASNRTTRTFQTVRVEKGVADFETNSFVVDYPRGMVQLTLVLLPRSGVETLNFQGQNKLKLGAANGK